MARTVAIGIQDFEKVIKNNYFYIDKTLFIKEWWESGDDVTLITRPRRFGKTLNMSMVEDFFSIKYAERGDLFEELDIWKDEKYRNLQGTYPVIFLSFAKVKDTIFSNAKKMICHIIRTLYDQYDFLWDSEKLNEGEKAFYDKVSAEMDDYVAADSLNVLSRCLTKYYGKKAIILLDEYDTPLQEAYVNGYWKELVAFTRNLFNATFKTNPWLERGIMTGITRISKESIFSDLNNLKVVTTTSDEYATSFGFTEDEVFAAMEECRLSEEKEQVKWWYDGFVFGQHKDIYNPWSILNFLDTGKLSTYWANTSSNSLVGRLLRQGSRRVKEHFEILLRDGTIRVPIDEQIVYNQLDANESAIWSLLLASGYLKVLSYDDAGQIESSEEVMYELTLTNHEVKRMFQNMVRGWFENSNSDYNDFIKALLLDDVDAMNEYMNRVALSTFSYFDTGMKPSGEEPERFYHGFVLGLMIDLQGRYLITSNRESGFGRYDVILEPKPAQKDDAIIRDNTIIKDNAIILEFKVKNPRRENTLEDTLRSALLQIEEKQYAAELISRGIPSERIRSYGFAFEGKTVLIGSVFQL